MPDIDIDFCIKRRGEVIDYISQKYGDDHVAQIVTLVPCGRSWLFVMGRALGTPLDFVDRVAKLIPSAPGQNVSIAEALDTVEDLRKLYEKRPICEAVVGLWSKIEGFARHSSTHAAGLVISRDPLAQMVPLMNNDGQNYQFTLP